MSDAERLAALTDTFARLGAPDPELWAASELEEDIPQLARFLALRWLWPVIDQWQTRRVDPVVQRLLAAGATEEDLAEFGRLAASEAVFVTLWSLASADGSPYLHELEDELGDQIDLAELPGWIIVETRHGQPTGRVVRGLHESLHQVDPLGRDGRDVGE